MPAWIHDRAEHLLAKNPKMTKSQAFAIATQQGHKLGKNPKGYGTKEGKKDARAKYDKPRKEYVKTPNPKDLDSPKLAASMYSSMTDELWKEAKEADEKTERRRERGKEQRRIQKEVDKRTTRAQLAAGGVGAGIVAQPLIQDSFMRDMATPTGEGEAALHAKMRAKSPVSIHSPDDVSFKLPGWARKFVKPTAENPDLTPENVDKVLTERFRGRMSGNAAFIPGGQSIGVPGGKDAIVLGRGGFGDKAAVLGHEMGHADIHRSGVGRLLQNRLTGLMSKPLSVPLKQTLGKTLLRATPAGAVGAITARSDDERVRAAGRWAPALAASPMLAYEAGASGLGLLRMARGGAKAKHLGRGARQLSKAWGTYAAPVAAGTAASHLGSALAEPLPKKPKKKAKKGKEKSSAARGLAEESEATTDAYLEEKKRMGLLGHLSPSKRKNLKGMKEKSDEASRLFLESEFPQLKKQATSQRDNPYLLDQIGKPKVRPRRAKAPEPKHRVKLALQQTPGVFGMPSTTNQSASGLNPAKQLANSQKVGVPKLPQPKMKTLSMKTAAFATSQFSGTLGGGTRDIYRPSDAKYGGPPPPEDTKKTKKKSCGYSKMAAMADELAKLNGVATTPQGKLYSTQRVGSPKVTAPAGPSIAALSKPVGYGMVAPGAGKGTI